MARIYLSPLIVDIRNKQSDTVFSKWKGINYIRSRIIPSNPKSDAQMAVRDALSRLVSLWQDRLETLRLNNDKYVSGKDLSGFNWFIGENTLKERDDELLDILQEVGGMKLTACEFTTGGTAGDISMAFAPEIEATHSLVVYLREAGSKVWAKKIVTDGPCYSPLTVDCPKDDQEYQCYGHVQVKNTIKGEEVGDDWSNLATSHA